MPNVNGLRPRFWIVLLFALAWLPLGCGVQLGGDNWPGVSSAGDRVYIAHGAQVTAVDIAQQSAVWSYPQQSGRVAFLAAPGLDNDSVIIADYGEQRGTFTPGVIARVYALDDSDGVAPALLWQQAVANDRIIASPLQSGGIVFVGTAENTVVALDAADGRELWRQTLGHGVWGQPSRAGDLVVVTSLDRSVTAFNAQTGAEVWKQTLAGAIAAKPLIVDDLVLVAGFDGKLHGLNLADGATRWVVEATGWIWNAPAVSEEIAVFGDVNGNVFGVQLRDGRQLWQRSMDGAIEAGLVAHNGLVFVPVAIIVDQSRTGRIVALEAATGVERWRADLAYPPFSALTIAADALVVAYQDGSNPYVLQVYEPDTGRARWTYTPPSSR